VADLSETDEFNPEGKTTKEILLEAERVAKETYGGIHHFNEPMLVYIKKAILQKTHKIVQSEAHTTEGVYSITQMEMGVGQKPKFIITKGRQILPPGESEKYLRPATVEDGVISVFSGDGRLISDDLPALYSICKSQWIKPDKGEGKDISEKIEEHIEKMISQLTSMHEHNPIFYEETLPISEKELMACGPKITELIDNALYDGIEKDPELTDCMKAQIPMPDPELIRPEQWMKCAPHGVIITGPGCGKSTTAEKIGLPTEDPTPAGMIGFADSEGAKPGFLHNQLRTVFVDEISESQNDETASASLMTYMRSGVVRRSRGRGGIVCRGFSPLVYMGNPDPNVETALWEYAGIFENVIEKMTMRYEAFASRMAFLLFRPGMKSAKKSGYSAKESSKYRKVLEAVQIGCAPYFSRAFTEPEIDEWMNQQHTEAYLKEISDLMTRADRDAPLLQAYIKAQRLTNRNVRGMAIKLAMMDYLPDYLGSCQYSLEDGIINASAIIRFAENRREQIEGMTLSSFYEILDITTRKDSDDWGNLQLRRIKSEPREYMKVFVECCILLGMDDQDQEPFPMPLEGIKSFLKIVQPYDPNVVYSNLERLLERIRKNLEYVNRRLNHIGLKVSKDGHEYLISLSGGHTFETVCTNREIARYLSDRIGRNPEIPIPESLSELSELSEHRQTSLSRSKKSEDSDKNDKNDKGSEGKEISGIAEESTRKRFFELVAETQKGSKEDQYRVMYEEFGADYDRLVKHHQKEGNIYRQNSSSPWKVYK
jgi:hypothetical protein